jgi:hypothetical protein
VTRTSRFAIASTLVVGVVALVPGRAPNAASAGPTIEQFLAPGTPIVFTDDTHEPLLHKRYLYAFNRLEGFIARVLKGDAVRTTAGR